MGQTKKKKPKGSSPSKPPSPASTSKMTPSSSPPVTDVEVSPANPGAATSPAPLTNAQLTVPVTDLAIPTEDLLEMANAVTHKSEATSETTMKLKAPELEDKVDNQFVAPPAPKGGKITEISKHEKALETLITEKPQTSNSWADLVKGSVKPLQKKGTPFIIPSGEACIKIPNYVIEKNRKTWDCFVL